MILLDANVLIAAQAHRHGAALMTANISDFRPFARMIPIVEPIPRTAWGRARGDDPHPRITPYRHIDDTKPRAGHRREAAGPAAALGRT